eukprot:m.1059414 g.1059414  ORF g.1059414 m.1059414 type:complete len:445 (+) comp24209_c0_seq14:315-1649(+)
MGAAPSTAEQVSADYPASQFAKSECTVLEHGIRSWYDGIVGRRASTSMSVFDVPLAKHSRLLTDFPEGHIHTVLAVPNQKVPTVSGSANCCGASFAQDTSESASTASSRNANTNNVPVVLMHGFGSGAAVYHLVLPGLAPLRTGPVVAIDSLGCGQSSRPSNVVGSHRTSSVEEAEDFFVGGLERWRISMGYEKMALVGHSMGGYLAVSYAERYPERVHNLVLIGCAGIPEPPKDLHDKRKNLPLLWRAALGFWDSGTSPFSVMKYGPGRFLLGKYVANRFADHAWLDKDDFREYLYNNWTTGNPSAGGYGHNTLMMAGAYARNPLEHRLPRLKVDHVSLIYGETDWMNPENGFRVRDAMKADKSCTTRLDVAIVTNAGHTCVIDNPTGVVDAIDAALHTPSIDGQIFHGERPASRDSCTGVSGPAAKASGDATLATVPTAAAS